MHLQWVWIQHRHRVLAAGQCEVLYKEKIQINKISLNNLNALSQSVVGQQNTIENDSTALLYVATAWLQTTIGSRYSNEALIMCQRTWMSDLQKECMSAKQTANTILYYLLYMHKEGSQFQAWSHGSTKDKRNMLLEKEKFHLSELSSCCSL